MENIYISLAVSVLFFLIKLILDKDAEDTIKRKNLKDSIYVGLIVLFVLYTKDYYFIKETGKAKVFTNEPGF